MSRQKDELKVVIVANGAFPSRGEALKLLKEADLRISCDGAAHKLLAAGWQADVIIGDMDSLSSGSAETFSGEIIRVHDQDSNDLTKAVRYCHEKGFSKITILGATGLREDHSLGNISLMAEYARWVDVRLVSDYGEFFLVHSGKEVACRPGEQISIFSLDNSLKVSSKGLLYPLEELQLSHWYTASLNQATGDAFSLCYDSGDPLIIYRSLS